jgi:hypothetical protein
MIKQCLKLSFILKYEDIQPLERSKLMSIHERVSKLLFGDRKAFKIVQAKMISGITQLFKPADGSLSSSVRIDFDQHEA